MILRVTTKFFSVFCNPQSFSAMMFKLPSTWFLVLGEGPPVRHDGADEASRPEKALRSRAKKVE